MKLLYRVLRQRYARHPFDGEGAYRYGGRWSSPGVRLSYCSEHQSLAMLEYFVHIDKDDPPDDLALAVAEVPDDLIAERVDVGALPRNWRNPVAPAALARFGDDFARRLDHCLVLVPSVIAPAENNCLLNPEHASFGRIAIRRLRPLSYDPRMFGERGGRRKPPDG